MQIRSNSNALIGHLSFLRWVSLFYRSEDFNMAKENKVDWIIHFVANGAPCAECGEVENNFPQYICDAHTHGMDKYGHMEFRNH